MPTYEQLYNLNLGSLKSAVERWADTPTRFKELLSSFSDRVEKPFKAADWVGPMITVQMAQTRLSMCHKDYADAAVEAKGIHGILADVYGELKKAKEDLHHLADVTAPKEGFYVTASGAVLPRHPEDPTETPSGELGSKTKQQQKCDDLWNRIESVLDRASEADETASWALRRNIGGKNADAFNGKQVTTSLDSADASHAVQLIRHGNKMTDQQMSELQEIMHRNRNDPDFATAFYKDLGPKKAIETIARLSADMPNKGSRQETYKEIKKEMGLSLATATDPDNKPHLSDAWNADLRKAGSERINPTGGESKIPYYGYQALGEILREGNYDPHFLVPVAEHVSQLQVKHPAEIPNTGILEALGHSPEAATDFFNGPMHAYREDGSPKDGEPDLGKGANGKPIHNYLDYMTDPKYMWGQETHPEAPSTAWGDWDEYDKENEKALKKGPDALGHALEAAVSGRPYDDDSGKPVQHTAQEAGLMHKIVDKFGHHPDLLNAKDGNHPLSNMKDSLGNMTAEYMLDVQGAMGGDDANHPRSFPHYGADAGLASLNKGPLQQFLGEVGKDPHAYGAISQAQQAATTQAVSHVIDAGGDQMVDKAGSAVAPGAVVQGILSESRATATYDEKIAEDKEFNEGLQKGDKWAGRIIGMGLKRIPAAGDMVSWAIEDSREAVVKQYTRDSNDAAHQSASAYVEENRENAAKGAQRAALNAAKQAGLSDEKAAALGTAAYTQANTSYGDGRHRQSGIGKG